ncbi:hypothetical protein [Amycolatopsis sp. NPDC058986]|uniref:hypothetical protein n=1 Tax=unclassified Amycolatopsis TaxID=2618356 RepID=UPI00366FEE6D
MKRIAARVLLPLAAAAVLTGVAGGVADAAPAEGTPIWVTPDLDLGGLLGPAVQAPTQLLAPIFGLITPIS